MTATTYQYIVKTPDVCSGLARIEGTRVGVHDIVSMIQTGSSIDQIVASLPHVRRSQVYACLAYFEDHREEIDPLVQEQIKFAHE